MITIGFQDSSPSQTSLDTESAPIKHTVPRTGNIATYPGNIIRESIVNNEIAIVANPITDSEAQSFLFKASFS